MHKFSSEPDADSIIRWFDSPKWIPTKHQLDKIEVRRDPREVFRTREGGGGLTVVDIIRDLAGAAADAPKKTGVPRKTGSDNILRNREGNPILKIDRQTPRQMTLTLLPKGGGTREEAEAALLALVRDLWA